ncbi:tetratricopeptide repeat protein [Acaryochloris sp. 'Moss Beach']|uniref:tetratricopeptide repeat protein n=1 Tax=Acaryochloris sp. 'Moss Beach' TaxID=2740837 RepID=UPI001F2F5A05|nr:tetratricopeptide repeat protein [Acaryochloris sp. 'Moss Beach']UJB68311.1 tetratricopeptide repeat protein [Acaryochloris sp. 'Moss Beach']
MRRFTLPLALVLALSAMPSRAQLKLQLAFPPFPPPTEAECAQDWTGMQADLEKALAKTPKHEIAGGYHALGQAFENCQKFDEAIAAFERGKTLQSWHAQYQFDIARVRVRQKKLTQALNIYRQYHRSESKQRSAQEIDGLAYNDLGKNLVVVGELDRAIATFDHATRLTPKNAAIWNNLGQTQVKAQKLELALKSFRQAVLLKESTSLSPRQLNARSYLQVGKFLTTTKQLKEGVPFLENAIALDPQYSDAYLVLGQNYAQQRLWDDAIINYTQQIKLSPKNKFTHTLMGDALIRKEDLEGAFSQYRQFLGANSSSIENDPQLDAEAYQWLAKTLKILNRLEPAVEAYQSVVALKPKSALTLNELGVVLTQLERWEEAVVVLKKAQDVLKASQMDQSLSFGSEIIAVNLGRALAGNGQVEEALMVLRQAAQDSTENPFIVTTLSRVLLQAGQTQEARQMLKAGLKQGGFPLTFMGSDPTPNAKLETLLGQLYFDLKQYDSALKHYQKAIQIDPEFAVGHSVVGTILRRQGKPDQAIPAYEKALKLQPRNLFFTHQFLSGRGLALLAQGKVDAAIADLEQATRLNANNVEALHGLGKALLQQNKPSAAIPHLEAAYDLNPRYPQVAEDLQLAKSQTSTESAPIQEPQ